jgi:aldehyde:ferredoxin oxidoreductase
LTRLITGIELSPEQMKEAAERCYTLERMFNNREGMGRKDDTLPERYFVEPTPLGIDGFKGKVMDREKFEQMLDEYYQAHGWDTDGVPTPETLEKLGLNKL